MMKYLLIILLAATLLLFFLAMLAGMKAMHGEEFFVSHLQWAMAAVVVSFLSNILAVMYAFKVDSEYAVLAARLLKEGKVAEGEEGPQR